MLVLRDRSTAPQLPRHPKRPLMARRSATRSTTGACSRPHVSVAACVPPRQARGRRNASRIWKALPCHRGVASTRRGASRAFYATRSPLSTRRNTPGGVHAPRLRKRPTRRRSSISIRSEHAMGGVTRDRRVQDTRRRFTDGMRDTRRDTCWGLQTVRLQYPPWHSASS
jgi:hypothetical protein